MKVLLTALVLSFTVFNAQANCYDKLVKTEHKLAKVYKATSYGLFGAALLGANTTPLVVGFLGLALEGKELTALYYLLENAQKGEGEYLDRLSRQIDEARPDLADKSKLAAIINEASEKETICEHGYITGSLLRTLIVSGELEEANASNRPITVSDYNIGE